MIIENKATGRRFEIAEGTLYDKTAYREVKPVEKKEEIKKVNPEPYIETPIAPEQRPEPKEEKPKKTRKRKSSKKAKAKKTSE